MRGQVKCYTVHGGCAALSASANRTHYTPDELREEVSRKVRALGQSLLGQLAVIFACFHVFGWLGILLWGGAVGQPARGVAGPTVGRRSECVGVAPPADETEDEREARFQRERCYGL